MNLRLAASIAFASQLLAGAILAQPALERVEQQLRKQIPARRAAAGDATAAEDENAGYLGVIADDRNEDGKGVRVMEAVATGPAAKGGLKPGDLITAIDDQPVKNVDDMTELLAGRHAGALVKFSVDRKGETRELQVRLERRPPPEKRRLPTFGKQAEDMPAPSGAAGAGPLGATGPSSAGPGDSLILSTRRPKLGIRTVNLTPFIREQARLPGSYVAGVFVTFVDPDSPSGKGGLPNNAIITAVDGEPIDSPDTLKALVDRAGPGQVLTVTYYFRDHETQAVVTLAGGPPQPPAPGPQATVRAKPVPAATEPPAQLPGFAPDDSDAADSPAPPDKASPPDKTAPADKTAAAEKIAALERRIAELEKRVAELESHPDQNAPAENK